MFGRSYFFGTDTRMTMTTASRAMTSQYFQLPLSLLPTMRTFCVVSTSRCVVWVWGRRTVVYFTMARSIYLEKEYGWKYV